MNTEHAAPTEQTSAPVPIPVTEMTDEGLLALYEYRLCRWVDCEIPDEEVSLKALVECRDELLRRMAARHAHSEES
jgi:hypothetical protein